MLDVSKRSDRGIIEKTAIDIAGFGLIIISPFLGWLPGPGGIPIFLAGVAILARNYDWADNLLKNFDKQRVEFTNKYLVNNKKVSRTIDLLAFSIILTAAIIIFYSESTVLRLLSIGVASFAVFIIISNQKRLDKFINKLKK